jgi:hypothetical protein
VYRTIPENITIFPSKRPVVNQSHQNKIEYSTAKERY